MHQLQTFVSKALKFHHMQFYFFFCHFTFFFNPPIGESRGTGARSQGKGWKNHMNNKKKKKPPPCIAATAPSA